MLRFWTKAEVAGSQVKDLDGTCISFNLEIWTSNMFKERIYLKIY